MPQHRRGELLVGHAAGSAGPTVELVRVSQLPMDRANRKCNIQRGTNLSESPLAILPLHTLCGAPTAALAAVGLLPLSGTSLQRVCRQLVGPKDRNYGLERRLRTRECFMKLQAVG